MKRYIKFIIDYIKDVALLSAIICLIAIPWYIYELIVYGELQTNAFDSVIALILAGSIYINIKLVKRNKEYQSKIIYERMWNLFKRHNQSRLEQLEGKELKGTMNVRTVAKYNLTSMNFIERIEKNNPSLNMQEVQSIIYEGREQS
ncbi:hypothetical protein [Heyndrickxia sporothermodurans]|uniref:hypothetical protein n=1 Tax=Heyndrickxia sporothermodurans TaxID=46224 RepID=UPI000D3A0963|nr:hypothetical protein [Heyndrickxia sporothermodurans]PTY93047.1 hypothetical protein B5V90_02890 [Heyndrickxia sporothermodurans]